MATVPEARPDAAAVLWSSMSSALTLSCIRAHGQAEAAALEFEAERRRHEPLLATTTGPAASKGPWRCAEAHLDLDVREGLRPEVVEDASRVWLRYRTPHWSGHGTTGPPATPAAFGPAIGNAHYRARHGLTAAVLGGPDVVFVHTHDVTDGDACDAGYFARGSGLIGTDGNYVRSAGEDLPAFAAAERPPPGPGTVTPWASATAWRMIVLTERLGVVDASAVIEHALRTVLTACWQWLPGALGLNPVHTPFDAACLYAATARLLGDDVEVSADHGSAMVQSTTERFWDGHQHVPSRIREAIVRGWSASLTHHGWDLRAHLVPPRAGEVGPITIVFDRSGPGD